jgi:hypothetical protein
MVDIYEQTALWRRTLGDVINDPQYDQRAKLRTSLKQMRKSVGELISEIPADCRELTVHDVSHLDALWEMADLIVGQDFPVTPVEAFVFGAAVLLHDAGLAFAAYPGGLTAVKEASVWLDTEAFFRRTSAQISQPSIASESEIGQAIAFFVLRTLHAQQAENLAIQAWPTNIGRDKIYLLNDVELRQSFGRSIGRIACSHHWDLDRVAVEMRDGMGPSPDLPAEWLLSESKVAMMLRCADIAHIDRRRAPTILLASKTFGPQSLIHWQFQNRINRPSLRENALTYSSGEDFPLEMAQMHGG